MGVEAREADTDFVLQMVVLEKLNSVEEERKKVIEDYYSLEVGLL